MPETIGVPVKDEPAFTLYPALKAGEGHVGIRLFEHSEEARRSHREGVVMLYSLTFRKEIAILAKYLTLPDDCRAAARHFGGAPALESLLVRKTMERLFNRDIRTETLFREHGEAVRPMILSTGQDCLREIQPVLLRFRTAMPQRFEVARNDVKLHGAVIEIDDASGKAVKIQRVSEAV